MKRPKPFAVGSVRVRVHSGPREDGAWRWRADRQGPKGRESVWSGWGTRAEAEAAVLQAMTGRGKLHEAIVGLETVRDLLEVWLPAAARRDRSDHTARARTGAAMRIARASLGDVRLTDLGYPDFEEYDIAYDGATSTLGLDLRCLRAAWTWGRRQRPPLVEDRDLPSYQIHHDGGAYSRYTPSPAEVADVLAVLRDRCEWAWRACYLLWATGCRPGEIATLTWADVRGGLLTVRGKTGARTVPMHPVVAAEVASWRVGPQLLRQGRPTETPWPDSVVGCRAATVTSRLHDWLREVTADLDLPRWSPYGLRRSAVQRLYARGQDPSVAATLLGHSPAVALRHYRQVSDDEMRAAVEAAGMGLLPGAAEVIDLEARKGGR